LEIGNRVCCVVYVVGLSTAWIIRGQAEKRMKRSQKVFGNVRGNI